LEGCRRFPSNDYNDCKEEGFCLIWDTAAYSMVLATIIGWFAWLTLVFVIIAGRRMRETMWGPLAMFLMGHGKLRLREREDMGRGRRWGGRGIGRVSGRGPVRGHRWEGLFMEMKESGYI
jgi:hypothetical protein